MSRANIETGPTCAYAVSIALGIALASIGAAANLSAQEEKASGGTTRRMAPFYNFGRGSQALFRQSQGEKQMAISVRCVRD